MVENGYSNNTIVGLEKFGHKVIWNPETRISWATAILQDEYGLLYGETDLDKAVAQME